MRRHLITIVTLLCICILSSNAAIKWNSAYQNYINKYKDIAIEQMRTYGIPASITLAQGLFESGAGLSRLATKANNHFGIKCHNGWTGGTIYVDDDKKDDCFRAYNTARESFIDHSKFLQGNRYKSLYSLKTTDYKGWARGLKACGYATNPQYAEKLIEIIELYKLYNYDSNTAYQGGGTASTNTSRKKDFDLKEAGTWLDRIFKKAKAGTKAKTKTKTTKKKKEDLLGRVVKNHRIYMYNDNLYIIAQQGETFRSIALDVNISYRALAKYNERDKNTVLANGDIVYLKKKAKKAERKYKGYLHTVIAGQSMYDISQMYGIRLSSLYKMNDLPNDYMPRVGDRLRVY